jgi:hypothetical protein
MPLLDHFHTPLRDNPPWTSVNTFWVANLARWLNRNLPRDRYQARAHAHLGSQIEADVAEFEPLPANGPPAGGGVATLPQVEAALATIPAVFPDEFAVHLVDRTDTHRLVGVVEFVSPGNKKEVGERETYVAKCVAYLRQGIGLVIVDVVSDRRANLHNVLVRRLGQDGPPATLPEEPLYVAGYGPTRRAARDVIDLWPKPLAVGQPIPTVPLPLRDGPLVPLPLEATYAETLADSNL